MVHVFIKNFPNMIDFSIPVNQMLYVNCRCEIDV